LKIRLFAEADWPAVWAMLEPVFRAGETYAYARDISAEAAHDAWVTQPAATFVAEDHDGQLLGTYCLKPNQPGQGAHVCNCGYVVAAAARGHGVASALCEHSQREGVARGFEAMQFNFVASSNEGAVRLWKQLGFAVAGVLPKAFRHPRLGLVDALVMFKPLGLSETADALREPIEVVREFWRLMATNDFAAVGAVLADDYLLDWPQTNERLRGRERFAAMNAEYPAHGRWTFAVDRLFGHGAEVVSDVRISDGVQHARAISFFTVAGGRISRQVEYWPEPYAAPTNRSHLVELIDGVSR